MAKISKFLSFLLIVLMILLVGYKAGMVVKKNHEDKMWLVLDKKVTEKAHQCYIDGKCTNKTVTISYLIANEYLINVVNPVTKEVINTSSYVNLDTNEFVILY